MEPKNYPVERCIAIVFMALRTLRQFEKLSILSQSVRNLEQVYDGLWTLWKQEGRADPLVLFSSYYERGVKLPPRLQDPEQLQNYGNTKNAPSEKDFKKVAALLSEHQMTGVNIQWCRLFTIGRYTAILPLMELYTELCRQLQADPSNFANLLGYGHYPNKQSVVLFQKFVKTTDKVRCYLVQFQVTEDTQIQFRLDQMKKLDPADHTNPSISSLSYMGYSLSNQKRKTPGEMIPDHMYASVFMLLRKRQPPIPHRVDAALVNAWSFHTDSCEYLQTPKIMLEMGKYEIAAYMSEEEIILPSLLTLIPDKRIEAIRIEQQLNISEGPMRRGELQSAFNKLPKKRRSKPQTHDLLKAQEPNKELSCGYKVTFQQRGAVVKLTVTMSAACSEKELAEFPAKLFSAIKVFPFFYPITDRKNVEYLIMVETGVLV